MRALIAGNNPLNDAISEYFAEKGIDTLMVEQPSAIRALEGEIGMFEASMPGGLEPVDMALLTELPSLAPQPIGGGAVYDINAPDKLALLKRKPKIEPIVILLDWYNESSSEATTQALKEAKHLADNKRQVWFLARFVRTAGHEVETLYNETRKAGVFFIKYEQLDISYDDDTMLFTLDADDGVLKKQISTTSIFADGPRGLNENFSALVKKLNLRTNSDGFVTEDRYYLTPVNTSRKGVYHITREVAVEGLINGLEMALADFGSTIIEDPYYNNIAEIDGEKCVLCYSCVRACPHGAMRPDTKARRMTNLNLACQGCGACASVCPGNAITLLEDSEIHAEKRQPKTLVLCCENSASEALEEALPSMGSLGARVEMKPMPCGGRIGLEELSAGLRGYDKVMVAVCMDDACRHIDGNKRACRQTERMVRMLEESGAAKGRIAFTQTSCAMPGVLSEELAAFIRGDEE